MENFYLTQPIPKFFGETTNENFSKTNANLNPFGTFKSQDTNFTTFQKTNKNKLLKDESVYSTIKLQYTIVSDFLSKMNLNYTLNSFNNEIKDYYYPNTPFILEEISELIDMNTNDLNSTNNLFSGNLKNTYLYYLIISKSNINKENKGIQTILTEKINNNENNILNDNPNLYEELNEKLKKIDEKYDKQPLNYNPTSIQKNNLESKFNRFKRELSEKYKEDIKNEIERIRSMEVGKVIIEQNQKYLERIEKIKYEYENKYELKIKELDKKRKELKEKENKIEMETIGKTKELISQYQQKIENLNKKEEAFNQKFIKELNDLNEQKRKLDKKDKELFILKKDYDKKLENEIYKLKNEFKELYKEQLKKIYKEKDQEIESINNELIISRMSNNFSTLKANNDKVNEECLKNLIEIKENLKALKSENKQKKSALNKRIIPLSDNEEEKAKIDISYYEKINELESRFNKIVNKFKYKHFNSYNIHRSSSWKSDLKIKNAKIKSKLDNLEKMEKEFNLEFEKDLKKFKEDIPEVTLSKKEIEKIKDNNYKIALSKIEREKQLNEIYKKENEEENALNKVKYINEINQNQRDKYDDTVKRKNYIIIDKNEMDEHKKMFLKLYREKREKQIKEENLQKENLIKNLELYKIAKKEKRVKIKETDMKIRDKRDEEKSQYSKSIALPPVKNPKEKKLLESAQADEIEELIHKSKIRIAESKEKSQLKDRVKLSNNSQEEDEYGSGDFYDISNEDKKSKNKNETNRTNRTNRVLSTTNRDNVSDNYNDFETTKALNKLGIHSEISEKSKSNEDSKF